MIDTVKNILNKYLDGLSLYSIYIKARFQISLDELEQLLKDSSQFTEKNGRYIKTDIERVSASLFFYAEYYKTKDIIMLRSSAKKTSDRNESLSPDEITTETDFIMTPQKLVGTEDLPQYIKNLLLQKNTVIPSHNIPDFMLKSVSILESWGYVKYDETIKSLDINDRSVIPTFYIDYEESESSFIFYPKFFVGKELVSRNEVISKQAGDLIRKNTSWRKVGLCDDIAHESIIKALNLTKSGDNYQLGCSKFVIIDELEHNRDIKFVYSSEAKDFVSKLKNFNLIDHEQLPEVVQNAFEKQGIKLRDYQKIGINWLTYLRKSGINGLVADDMGLGKTIQVISALASAYEEYQSKNNLNMIKPSLVVCPKSVVMVWKQQLSMYYPTIRTGIIMGKNKIEDYLKSATATNKIILLTSFETIASRKDSFLSYDYLYVILDEAQKIKNPQTQMAKSIKSLKSTYKIAMTGTPIENRLTELWSIFDFIIKGHLGSKDSFKVRFEKPISDGNTTVMNMLKRRIEPFKIRRTKKQKDEHGKGLIRLPEMINDNITLSLGKEETKLYRRIINSKDTIALKHRLEDGENMKSLSMSIFSVLTRLKQVCNHPSLLPDEIFPDPSIKSRIRSEKFSVFTSKIEEIVESEQKVVVFSQYRQMLSIMESYLNKNGIGYSLLVGGMTQKNREQNITKFQLDDDNKYPVFLASLKAGGVGISLTSASNVIHYDRWWNPAVENQATDRAYRSGNESIILNVYKLIAENTIEEKIDSIMKKKQALSNNIMEEDNMSPIKSFTKEELISLLSE